MSLFIQDDGSVKAKLNLPGRTYKLDVHIIPTDGSLRLKYGYCKEMNDEVKAMQGAKYHGYDNPDHKFWTISDSPRNWFSLRFLAGEDVFACYDASFKPLDNSLYPDAYPHQLVGAGEVLARHRILDAWEMGTCKTRTIIMVMEQSGFKDWWWVGTRGSLREMPGEFYKWKSKIQPNFLSYDELKKVMSNWTVGRKAPRGVVFDEFSKAKSHTSQRGQACYGLSCEIEKDWGEDGYVIGLTGTPQPKDPRDWWHLIEVIKPGFLREGSHNAFSKRMGLTITKQGQYGAYPEHVTWWDDERKCKVCGKLEEFSAHDFELAAATGENYHGYVKSVNEVTELYKRMKGVVSIKFKKDVLKDLPEKRFHVERLKPSDSILRAAKTILNTAPSTIIGLTLLRELSDGFQYIDVPDGKCVCTMCGGHGVSTQYFNKMNPDEPIFDVDPSNEAFDSRVITCPNCNGTKEVVNYLRDTKEVACPKDDYFEDLLENHEDVGRFVVYAPFTGSIDRCCNIARRNGWSVIRIDARGWHSTDYSGVPIDVKSMYDKEKGDPYLQMFQTDKERHPRVCVVAHPKSGGMGLTLTASPGLLWFGLVFDGEDYMQACDRIHRPGMDLNRGATIYIPLHLPTDELVYNNLCKKVDLQNMSLGIFKENLEDKGERRV